MKIVLHTADDGSTSISVQEALQTEQIADEIFERSDPRFIQIWDFSDLGPRGCTGFFRVTARNGQWTYRFTRKIWWLDHVYEAEMVQGEVLLDSVWSTGSGPGGAAPA